MRVSTKGTGLAMLACVAAAIASQGALADGVGSGPDVGMASPARDAPGAGPHGSDVAASLSARWEGKALRIEGAGDVECVRFSTSRGGCMVYRRGSNGALSSTAGTCALSARGRKATYLALSCRTGVPAASGGVASADSCVPGRGFNVINMTAAFALSGDEESVGDASLPRRASVVGATCDTRTPNARVNLPDADAVAPSSGTREPRAGTMPPDARVTTGVGADATADVGAAGSAVSLRARADASSAAAGGRHDRVSMALARLEGAGALATKGLVPPSHLPEAHVTEALNAKWNGRAVEMDTGSVVYCVNFSRTKGTCTAFFKDKATQAVQGPSSGDCAVRASQGNAALAFTFLSGKELRTNVLLRSAVAGHEETFPGRNGQDFWRLRDRPCLSSNF